MSLRGPFYLAPRVIINAFCSLAYRSGVTVSVTAPIHDAWLGGLSVAFSVGAPHKLANGAILHDAAAVHCSLSHGDSTPSVSTKIAAMRRLLTGKVEGEIGEWFAKVAQVSILNAYRDSRCSAS